MEGRDPFAGDDPWDRYERWLRGPGHSDPWESWDALGRDGASPSGDDPSSDDPSAEELESDDPWDHLVLDEAFVRASPVIELSADERMRLRQAHLERVWDVGSAPLPPDIRPRRRAGRIARAWISGLLVLAMLAGLARWTGNPTGSDAAADGERAASDQVTVDLTGGRRAPTPSAEAADHPLGTAPEVIETGHHEFLITRPDGSPVAYDPCRPVHYVVNERTAPPGAKALLDEAIARVSAATGLVFVDDGTTTERPSDHRSPYQPTRYGDRWAPVLIAWSDPAETPGLADDVAGRAGSIPVTTSGSEGPTVYVTGTVTLDGPQITEQLLPRSPDLARAVVQHELGHLVGLDHVGHETELMHPSTTKLTDWGPGDRAGLAQLGRGECHPDL